VNIALWILAGSAIGWLAYAVIGYNAERGMMVSIIIGVFGAFVGGLVLAPAISSAAAVVPGDISMRALFCAAAVAATLLFLGNVSHKRWGL
jgi:uncharacterized membrane protein YeaQ/YmgE (transglycosylase-associated protein family)